MTQDVDIVLVLSQDDATTLVSILEEHFLIQADTVAEAVQRKGMFQALHRELLIKVDFHVGPRIEGELDRSVRCPLFAGVEVPLVSKDDAILSKLMWARKGSENSRRDVLGMLLDPGPFDLALVRSRAEQLGCREILERIEQEARGAR